MNHLFFLLVAIVSIAPDVKCAKHIEQVVGQFLREQRISKGMKLVQLLPELQVTPQLLASSPSSPCYEPTIGDPKTSKTVNIFTETVYNIFLAYFVSRNK